MFEGLGLGWICSKSIASNFDCVTPTYRTFTKIETKRQLLTVEHSLRYRKAALMYTAGKIGRSIGCVAQPDIPLESYGNGHRPNVQTFRQLYGDLEQSLMRYSWRNQIVAVSNFCPRAALRTRQPPTRLPKEKSCVPPSVLLPRMFMSLEMTHRRHQSDVSQLVFFDDGIDDLRHG